MASPWDAPLDGGPALPDLPGPGLKRRRMLRAAGINLHISDFTGQEQLDRGFHPRAATARLEPL